MNVPVKVTCYKYATAQEMQFFFDLEYISIVQYFGLNCDGSEVRKEYFNCTHAGREEFKHTNLPILANECGVLFGEDELFQMSVVWGHDFPFELLVKLQEYFFSNLKDISKAEGKFIVQY